MQARFSFLSAEEWFATREDALLEPLLILLSAQAAQSGPVVPPAPSAKATAQGSETCSNELPTEPGEIVVCAVKPDGYRINPDVLAAKRAIKNGRRPKKPERFADKSCETIGPMGCRGTPTIDLVGAALAAATMAQKAANGESVGKMFVTDPQPTEYELYLEAKQEREDKEAAAAIKAEQSRTAQREHK
ncbi:hypothetical protein G7077_05425 [Sphingomonas piscis]|uniref:Uncharacterized protein n=1 Tax=Sphingomonas piscis TaxID=2714943 RepID=A0A6G7YNV9_9SPHN|nr:hypothetical protein [Sphingomonas piscis]QIK78430.1 hypothetical protein G7077_05425 [Sphingomonas piscis]